MLILLLMLFATTAYFAFGPHRATDPTRSARVTAPPLRSRFFSSPLAHWRGSYLSLGRRDRQQSSHALLVLNSAVRRWASNLRLWRSSASDDGEVLAPPLVAAPSS